MKTKYARVIGVDIGSEKLDVNDSAAKISSLVLNTVAAIQSHIVGKIDEKDKTLVVCEGSGGFEHVLVDALHEAGIAVCVANPRQVRDHSPLWRRRRAESDAAAIARGEGAARSRAPPRPTAADPVG